MDDRFIFVDWGGKRIRLEVDVLRALYYAVTNRRVFLAITGSDIPEKEDPADIAKRKKMSRIEFCQEKIRKCRAELAGLKGAAAKAMRQMMYYYRHELNKAKYQYTYRKTDKYRKWKREYTRQYRARRKSANSANNEANESNEANGQRAGTEGQREAAEDTKNANWNSGGKI